MVAACTSYSLDWSRKWPESGFPSSNACHLGTPHILAMHTKSKQLTFWSLQSLLVSLPCTPPLALLDPTKIWLENEKIGPSQQLSWISRGQQSSSVPPWHIKLEGQLQAIHTCHQLNSIAFHCGVRLARASWSHAPWLPAHEGLIRCLVTVIRDNSGASRRVTYYIILFHLRAFALSRDSVFSP